LLLGFRHGRVFFVCFFLTKSERIRGKTFFD